MENSQRYLFENEITQLIACLCKLFGFQKLLFLMNFEDLNKYNLERVVIF